MPPLRSFLNPALLGLLLTLLPIRGEAAVVKVFLLAGQSNMDGRAASSGLPVELQSPQTDVLFYEGGNLRDLQPGSGTDFGPEITFGRSLADANPSESYGLIKYGTSGTNLHTDWDPATGTTYSNFNSIVANGIAAIEGQGHTVEIVGMLWTQGERDAKDNRTTAQYEADLNGFIADVRTRYGSDLPFFLSRLSINQTNISSGQLTEIRGGQDNVAAGDANTWLIDTDAMGLQGDNLHFDADGQIALGNAFASSYLATVPEPSATMLLLPGLTLLLRRKR